MKALLGVLAMAVLVSPAFAYDDPKALVEAIYAPYQTPGAASGQDPAQFYSERLKGLVAANAASGDVASSAADAAAVPAPQVLDFNPFIAGQHSLLMDLAIGEPMVQGDHAVVNVSFHNFDRPELLSLSLVRDADGWKVDDVAALGGGETWLLSWLLQYDPFSVQ